MKFLIIFLGLVAFASAAGVKYTFSRAGNYPGVCSFCTVPLGVNTKHIFGYYEPPNNTVPGYIQTGGSFFSVLPFGGESAFVGGMNRYGVAVGGYCPAGSSCGGEVGVHGFMLKGGIYTNIDYPLSGASTIANGINDLGQIVGGYCPSGGGCPGGLSQPSTHGFLDDNGAFTSLDYPGAQQTQALAINNSGAIVGIYLINLTGPHAFLYQNGAYKNIDFPGAATWPGAVNNHGVVAGYYSGSSGLHGFHYQNGVFATIDVPRARATSVTGISDNGEIVGLAVSASGTHNFKGIPVGRVVR
jgi:probable HAF family extracellular repeat protein